MTEEWAAHVGGGADVIVADAAGPFGLALAAAAGIAAAAARVSATALLGVGRLAVLAELERLAIRVQLPRFVLHFLLSVQSTVISIRPTSSDWLAPMNRLGYLHSLDDLDLLVADLERRDERRLDLLQVEFAPLARADGGAGLVRRIAVGDFFRATFKDVLVVFQFLQNGCKKRQGHQFVWPANLLIARPTIQFALKRFRKVENKFQSGPVRQWPVLLINGSPLESASYANVKTAQRKLQQL